ncbi:MAG: FAD-binding oxidoreductase [Rhodospirillaceae bacterium]|jgi:FAD/FMN-containing dehydrogenase|nr:FAD-binding oxidoreductase [Rhodospirillaceae bacterium]
MTLATASSAIDDALARIREIVGPKGWIDDAKTMAPHLLDERKMFTGTARAIVRPASTEEVAAVVSVCAEAGIPIVPQGGNTSLVGGSVPDEGWDGILLSLGRMNRIRAIDPLNHTITVEAGCILAAIQDAADEADRLFPLSLGAEGTCQIGGNLSTNAGGTGVLRYGNARELTLGIEAVLPDGQVWNGLKGLRKDNTGYDLKQLFIGGEGTLGIITAAVLKLFPKPKTRATALVALAEIDKAGALLSRMRAATGDQVTGFELMPRNAIELAIRHVPDTVDPLTEPYEFCCLIELTSADPEARLGEALEGALGAAFEEGEITDAVIAASEDQADRLWFIREAIPIAQKVEGGGIKHDISVPVSQVTAFIREATKRIHADSPDIRIFAFGHLGDGNVHYNLCWPDGQRDQREAFLARWEHFNRIVHDLVTEMGGSISAEHGIGRLKKDELAHYAAPVELEMMRKIKAALDPQGLMNPGRVL